MINLFETQAWSEYETILIIGVFGSALSDLTQLLKSHLFEIPSPNISNLFIMSICAVTDSITNFVWFNALLDRGFIISTEEGFESRTATVCLIFSPITVNISITKPIIRSYWIELFDPRDMQGNWQINSHTCHPQVCQHRSRNPTRDMRIE